MKMICTDNPEHTFTYADEEMNFCCICGGTLVESKEPIHMEIYLNSCKEAMYDAGADAGLSDEALREFQGTAYELTLSIIVDPATGIAKCYEVNGVGLFRPVKI